MHKALRLGSLVVLIHVSSALAARAEEARPANPNTLRLGLVSSLFRDTPRNMVQILAQPLGNLIEAQTGLTGQLESTADLATLAKQLQQNQVDLAIFHGFEFAWVKQKHPELQPLLLVSNSQPLQAFLVVAEADPLKKCEQLQGKTLVMPRRSREHLHLFLERRCCCGKTVKDFFARVKRAADAEDALDDVVEGMAQAALVDAVQLAAYRKSKPEQFSKLRVLLKSEVFPAGVIAYRAGALTDDMVQRIRTGMMAAHQTRQGRELLHVCKMAGFELAPDDFDKTLQAIARAYPPLPDK